MDSKQIIDNALPLRWDLFFKPLPIFFLVISIILAWLIWLVWEKRGKRDFLIGPKELGASDNSLKLFYGWVPLILGVHLAVALLVNGVQGKLFSSNNILEGSLSNWMGLAEIMIALSLFYGGLTRPAAVLLGFLWVLGFDMLGVRPMLESIQYLGFASFFYLAGRGPYAIDRMLFPNLEPSTSYTGQALLFLRIGVGLNLIVLGFTQKFANIPYVSSLLEHHDFLNFTTIPNEVFVLIAGALEVLAGILIVFGIFPRTTSLITLICINASLTVYNWNELVDYLPTYGALAVLLIWEPSNPQQKLMWVEGLRKNISDRSSLID
ncbi:MAG: DoxX family protein [Chitinophagaceae bacterium]|nr:DoxX family protein [Chitinophagaceae bacterium]